MSNRVANLVDRAGLGNPGAKTLLRTIADQGNDEGTGVWSSKRYLAWILEVDTSTVKRHIRWLTENKWLSRVARPGKSNVWKVNVPKLFENQRQWGVPDGIEGGVQDDPGQDTPDTQVQDEPLNPVLTNLPEPTRTPTDEMGIDLPPNKICTKCGERPKAPRAKKYCAQCQEEERQRWVHKLDEPAVRVWRKYAGDGYLQETQADSIIATAGDDTERWEFYCQRWSDAGYYMHKAGLGKLLTAFRSRSYDKDYKPVAPDRSLPKAKRPDEEEGFNFGGN